MFKGCDDVAFNGCMKYNPDEHVKDADGVCGALIFSFALNHAAVTIIIQPSKRNPQEEISPPNPLFTPCPPTGLPRGAVEDRPGPLEAQGFRKQGGQEEEWHGSPQRPRCCRASGQDGGSLAPVDSCVNNKADRWIDSVCVQNPLWQIIG